MDAAINYKDDAAKVNSLAREGSSDLASKSVIDARAKADTAYEREKLPPDAYKELEDAVGARYISEENFAVASHDWFGLAAAPNSEPLMGITPGAVILPKTAEEISKIIKICLKYKIKYKAHSTGYGSYSGVGSKGALSIDLRRMDTIEIDEHSRMAIIGPHAIAGDLIAEATKKRLMCHMVGAGPVHSPLASSTSFAGMGVAGMHTGINFRNLLAFEWVSPEGDIIRFGSIGNGENNGWFTGEGPGPGFRGMLRGSMGATGGLGVFTKIGYKLYPWAGPPTMEISNQHPQPGVVPPENFMTYQLGWNNWEDATKATHLMKNSKVVTFITRTPPHALGHFFSASNTEAYHNEVNGIQSDLAKQDVIAGWTVSIMAWSKKEFEWREGALNTILEQTNGFKRDISDYERDILTANSVASVYVHRHGRISKGGGVGGGFMESVNLIPQLTDLGEKMVQQESKPGGRFLEGMKDSNWMWITEGRHIWMENNPNSSKTTKDWAISMHYILTYFNLNNAAES